MPHVLPTGGGKALLDPDDAIFLLLDHQTGLLQTVQDVGIPELRANVSALAKVASLAHVPVVTTSSVPEGPNGPLLPELAELAPQATFVPRHGEISAWDNDLFVATVRETGRKTLVIAGIWTSVCVACPALDAKAAGYKVYAVTDASGDVSEHSSRTTLLRLAQAGVVPISTTAVVGEIQRTWIRDDADDYAAVYAMTAPSYRAVTESHKSAQEAAREGKRPSVAAER